MGFDSFEYPWNLINKFACKKKDKMHDYDKGSC